MKIYQQKLYLTDTKKALMELAQKHNYDISKIFREVVSGETLSQRPQMQILLNEVENNMYDGVLVMEVERLARGNSVDQGIIAQAFKYSNTLIITPTKKLMTHKMNLTRNISNLDYL